MLSLKPYRRAAVPLLAVQTADPAEVIRFALRDGQNGKTYPVLIWDCVHGLAAGNEQAQAILQSIVPSGMDPAIASGPPAEALRSLERLGTMAEADKAIVVMIGLAPFLAEPVVLQALWNLRDVLPRQGVLLVLAVPMGWRNPLPDDLAVVQSPLPDRDQLKAATDKICTDAKVKTPADLEPIADALLGLSGFASEQALALSLTKQGIDLSSLWARKRQQISETPGLSVYAGTETFADLGGLAQAKDLFTRLMSGRRKPGCIVFVDEIEKALAGAGGDTSGVAQDQLGCLLAYMQDQQASGAIFPGPPGAGKSAFAKAIGNMGNVPTVQLDMGGLKGSLVGQSEQRMRTALAVITAISGGRPFFCATCNAIAGLPPELRRRFTLGTMFFDLPTPEERASIWPIYLAKFGLADQALPTADGWTGAEIRQCADMADRLDLSLIEASRFVVPVSVSAREKIQALRSEANGRYLSASYPGVFRLQAPSNVVGARNVSLD